MFALAEKHTFEINADNCKIFRSYEEAKKEKTRLETLYPEKFYVIWRID